MNAVTWLGFAVEFRFNLEDFKYRGFEKVKSAEWVNLLTEFCWMTAAKSKVWHITSCLSALGGTLNISYWILENFCMRNCLQFWKPSSTVFCWNFVYHVYIGLYPLRPKGFAIISVSLRKSSPPTVAINGHMFLCHQLIVWAWLLPYLFSSCDISCHHRLRQPAGL